MSKTTVQISVETGAKLRKLKKATRLPVGLFADIGLDFVADGIAKGELVVSNGRVVRVTSSEPEKKAA